MTDSLDNVSYIDIINVRHIFDLLEKPLRPILKEDVENIRNLTLHKTIYDYWNSNDEGVSVELYKGLSDDSVTTLYFLMHFNREWFGGWNSADTISWYEISEQEFVKVCNYKIITQN